jgi:hypothetical protein
MTSGRDPPWVRGAILIVCGGGLLAILGTCAMVATGGMRQPAQAAAPWYPSEDDAVSACRYAVRRASPGGTDFTWGKGAATHPGSGEWQVTQPYRAKRPDGFASTDIAVCDLVANKASREWNVRSVR